MAWVPDARAAIGPDHQGELESRRYGARSVWRKRDDPGCGEETCPPIHRLRALRKLRRPDRIPPRRRKPRRPSLLPRKPQHHRPPNRRRQTTQRRPTPPPPTQSPPPPQTRRQSVIHTLAPCTQGDV